jgi:uncharacterized membrane protein YqjE
VVALSNPRSAVYGVGFSIPAGIGIFRGLQYHFETGNLIPLPLSVSAAVYFFWRAFRFHVLKIAVVAVLYLAVVYCLWNAFQGRSARVGPHGD